MLCPGHTANASSLLKVVAAMPRLSFGQGAPRGTPIVTSSCATGHWYHLLHQCSSLGPFGSPGSCLLVWQLCRGRWTGPLYLPVSAFILLEKELYRGGCGGRRWLSECPGPLSLTGLILIFLPLLNGGGFPSWGGSRAPSRLPSRALGGLAAAGIRRQMSGQWVVDVVGGLAMVLKVFLSIAAAWLLPSSGPSLLEDLFKPFNSQGAVKFIFLLFWEPRCPRAHTLWLWHRVERICP